MSADGRRAVVSSVKRGNRGPDIDDDEVRDDFIQVKDLVGAVSLPVVRLNGNRINAELRGGGYFFGWPAGSLRKSRPNLDVGSDIAHPNSL
jgi:hypothetical protein